MGKVMFDTNIYIYHSINYPDAVQVWDEYLNQDNEIIISTIQISELLSYHQIEQHPSLKRQRELYISLTDEIVFIDDIIARKAAELRRAWKRFSGKSLKLPDALIGATALVKDAILISNNDKDFLYLKKQHGLKYKNPIRNQQHLRQYIQAKISE